MAVSDFYTAARWPDFICISAHYKYVMMMMMMNTNKINSKNKCSTVQKGQMVLITALKKDKED